MNNLASATLSTNAEEVVVNATAKSMGISNSYVSFIGLYNVTSSRRRLMSSSGEVHLTSTYSGVAVTETVIPLSATSYASTDSLYSDLTSKLQSAIQSNSFTSALQASGSSELSSATVNTVTFSSVDVLYPETGNPSMAPTKSSSSSSSGYSIGMLIGVAVGAAVVMGIVLVGLYFCMRTFCSSKEEEDYPKAVAQSDLQDNPYSKSRSTNNSNRSKNASGEMNNSFYDL